jgi:ABC-type transport system involved in multi-copper enzyme maturation permease subunit
MTTLTVDTRRTLRSELTKIRSVRSTYWTQLLLVAAAAAWCVIYSLATVHQWPHMNPQDRANFDPVQSSVLGLAVAGQLVIVVLGALMITSEYSTGMIRTSLTVMPRRARLYWSKLAVFAVVSGVLSMITSFGAFFLGRALLAPTHVSMSLSQPGALRAVLISALYVEVCGLFAFGVGAIVRNTAAGLTIGFGFLILLPQLLRALPSSLYQALERWMPSGNALSTMTASNGATLPHMFSAWGELAVFAAYAIALVLIGAAVFRRRDA